MIRKGPSELTQSRETGRKRERVGSGKKKEKEAAEGDKRDGTRGYKRESRDRVGASRNRRGRGERKREEERNMCAHSPLVACTALFACFKRAFE